MSPRAALRVLAIGAWLSASCWEPSARAQPAPHPPPERATDVAVVFKEAVASHLEAEKAGAEAPALLRRAAAGYSKVLEERPGEASALYNLGRAMEQLGDPGGAAKSYQLAASRPGPDRPFYLRQWADFLAAQGRGREAEQAFEELVVADPRQQEPHAILSQRYLEARDASPALLDYLWKLVASGQASRAADLALEALERDWPSHQRAELLSAVAASLGQLRRSPAEVLESEEIRRLRAFRDLSDIGAGVVELLTLYEAPGNYTIPFRWWNVRSDEWAEMRGISRREAFRSAMRAIGDWYGERGQAEISIACYRAALEVARDPDPIALKSLATTYVEQGKLDALDALARKYTDPAGELFAAKNRAYQEGALEKVLLYHRALGQIYGALASSGESDWGDTSTPTTALFQLDRAFRIAKRLDDEGVEPPCPVDRCGEEGAKRSHVDPDLTVLLVEGLEQKAAKQESAGDASGAKASRAHATRVKLEAAEKLHAGGDARGTEKVLRGVAVEQLSPADRKRVEVYRKPQSAAATAATGVAAATPPKQISPAFTREVAVVTNAYRNDALVAQNSVAARTRQTVEAFSPRTVQVAADAGWVDTGIAVSAGQKLRISATGRWSNSGPPAQGPGGFAGYLYDGTMLPTAPLAALLGRVGDAMFLIGERYEGPSPASGTLQLGINDTPTLDDNQGSLTVTVQVE